MPAYAAAIALTVNAKQIPIQGGLPITVSGTNMFTVAKAVSGAGPYYYTGRLVGGASPTCTGANAGAAPAADGITIIDTGNLTRIDDNTASVVTPAVPTTGGPWLLCAYNSTDVGTAAATNAAVVFGKMSAITGSSVGGETLQLTAPADTFSGTSYAAEFNVAAAGCPATYATASGTNVVASTATKASGSTSVINVPVPRAGAIAASTAYSICIYNGTASNSTLVAKGDTLYSAYVTTSTANVTALPAATLNPASGTTGGTNAITLSVPTGTLDLVTNPSPAVIFTRGVCASTYPTVSTLQEPYAATTTPISSAKVAVTVPTRVLANGTDATTPWNACLYKSASSGALAALPATYTVAPVLTVTGATLGTTSGPSQGGTKILFTTLGAGSLAGIPTGTDVGDMMSATLGGTALTSIRVVSPTSFTAVTPAHAPGVVDLVVTTAAGSDTKTSAFTYTNGITVVPNTATAGSTPVLDVTGAGFKTIPAANWGSNIPASGGTTLATTAKARVVLTDNGWNQQDFTGAGLAPFGASLAPKAQCMNVLVISDSELICTMDLAHLLVTDATALNAPTPGNAVPEGVYNVTLINPNVSNKLVSTAGNYSVVSSGSTFTVSAF
ncbi:hypothetical protein ACQPZX_37770 [Actinoplanes sp. CA-142083]|uniref:hypothetical protein n=1 Tax=Actinoplanes sp. CA-142083 TaxID=3239903 RepID=UPI003D8A413F